MNEITVAELRADDVGRRVVVIHDGGTVEGTLDVVWTSWNEYAKPEPGPRTRIEVHSANVKVQIDKLPGEFLLQIRRGPDV